MFLNTKHKTEAEIQFLLGNLIIEKGYDVFFERNFTLKDLPKTKRKKRLQKVRADIVVCYKNRIICLIEVKNHKTIPKVNLTRQNYKYKCLNIPFYYCWNEDEIEKTLEFIDITFKKCFNN